MSRKNRSNKPPKPRIVLSCPDCGFGPVGENGFMQGPPPTRAFVHALTDVAFDCPRCKAHYAINDFWTEHQEKLRGLGVLPNTIVVGEDE